ncbi:hypothetical protein V8E54_015043 [Elaphomyces granulatus]
MVNIQPPSGVLLNVQYEWSNGAYMEFMRGLERIQALQHLGSMRLFVDGVAVNTAIRLTVTIRSGMHSETRMPHSRVD